jgi:hypothetical protein
MNLSPAQSAADLVPRPGGVYRSVRGGDKRGRAADSSRLWLSTEVVSLVAAGSASAADKAIRRTSSGHPDLSGTYDAATLTPLERPAKQRFRSIALSVRGVAMARDAGAVSH